MPALPPNSGPAITATLACAATGLFYAGGFFTLANPVSVALPEIQQEIEETDPFRHRRYLAIPIGLTTNAPQLGMTLKLEFGVAVNEDLPRSVDNMITAIEGTPVKAPLSEAMRRVAEDPALTNLTELQAAMPTYVRDALNEALGTEDMPRPVLEVFILKLITSR